MATEKVAHLQLLNQLFKSGMYHAVIDRVYTLREIVAAHDYVDTGRKMGNVVICPSHEH